MSAYLSTNHITKTYNIHTVLNGVSLILNAGERVGLVGANGVGKSTLLKIITGEIEADGGSVSLTPGMEIGYLAQVIRDAGDSTLADMIAAATRKLNRLEARMRELETAMAALSGAALDRALAEYGDASEQFERYGGYEIGSRAETVLNGLGVGHLPREQRFVTLSGGEKSRAALAMLLLGAPDVLLLDEPTNHLDFASLEWLENYLRGYRGAALIVSHDRQFLNRAVNAIVEIDEHQRTAKRYEGDYDLYHAAKATERRKWESDYAGQQEEIRALRLEAKETARRNSNYRTHTDSDKFMRNAKIATHEGTVSKRVRLAEEKLKRIEANPIPQPPPPLHFDPVFDPQALKSRLPLVASGLVKAFGERRILDGVDATLSLGSRVVLVGPNGAGKSTLLRILAGADRADRGELRYNPAARVGYLDQEAENLPPDGTLFDAFREGIDLPDQALKAILIRGGLFRYADLERPVSGLSSGQRRKVQIARLIAGRANLLILDEPTNYVSFDVLEALETALREFPGPVIAASHDRRFMQTFGGEIWELRDGQIIRYLNGYEEYLAAQYSGEKEVLSTGY